MPEPKYVYRLMPDGPRPLSHPDSFVYDMRVTHSIETLESALEDKQYVEARTGYKLKLERRVVGEWEPWPA